MKILGIDPGLHNYGYALLDNGRVTKHGVFLFPGKGKHPTEEYVKFLLPKLTALVQETKPDLAAVEMVGWYGRARRITLPLSHIAGATFGVLFSLGVPSFMLMPTMKKGVKAKKRASWSEHEYDAALLALRVAKFLRVNPAALRSAREKEAYEAMLRRKVPGLGSTVTNGAPTKRSKSEGE